MVFPHYLLNFGIPLIAGLIGLGLILYQRQNERMQITYSRPSNLGCGYDTGKNIPSSSCDICSICLEDLESSIKMLPCGHKLHHMCYRELIKREKRCPECRTGFSA